LASPWRRIAPRPHQSRGCCRRRPRSEQLAAFDSRLRVLRDSTLVLDEIPAGELTIAELTSDCEQSDPYNGGDRQWKCATHAQATILASFTSGASTYELAATLIQRERLVETCHSCEGVEGCNY
jgi:hypothetical protein